MLAEELCGPSVPGTTHSADLVASFNVLLSPNKKARENILRREVEMLRPEPGSTLLLLVPSAESYRAVRKLYRKLGGVESGLGKYADYLYDHPDEEADNVFRVFALTKHYSKKEACSMVEAAGLECDKVLSTSILGLQCPESAWLYLQYWKGGSEMSFGLLLGNNRVADTENVCKQNGECAKWPVYCLNANLTWLPASQAERASAVAKAWGGKVTGTCRNTTVFAETVAELVLFIMAKVCGGILVYVIAELSYRSRVAEQNAELRREYAERRLRLSIPAAPLESAIEEVEVPENTKQAEADTNCLAFDFEALELRALFGLKLQPDNFNVVVTGAAGNFGSVCAQMAAAEGAKLALVDLAKDRSGVRDKLESVAEDIKKTYSAHVKSIVMVTKEAEIEKMVADVKTEFGCIDCLFNNAGYQGLFAPVDTYSFEDFEKVLKINVTGVFAVLKHVSKVMVEQKTGAIVNTASCAGLGCPTMMTGYATSCLAAVLHLTKIAALDLAPSNIRVNSVSPVLPLEGRLKAFIGPDDGFMWLRQVDLQAKANPTGAPEQLELQWRYYSNDNEQVAKQMLETARGNPVFKGRSEKCGQRP
ncbi:lvr [Symbiodinium microadriaticum]|nr:lvr [Symbiodinium microadriaticum]